MTYKRLQQLTIIWIATLILGSLSPGEIKTAVGTETESRSPTVRVRTRRVHQIVHYVAFGIGAALLVAVGRTAQQRLLYCAALIVLGCALEWGQYLFLGSEFLETWDMRDDAIAVVFGGALASVFGFGKKARSRAFSEIAITR